MNPSDYGGWHLEMLTHRVSFSAPTGAAGPDEERRFARWWDEYRATISGIDLYAEPGTPFAARREWLLCRNATIGRVAGSMMWAERGPQHFARDGDDRIVIGVNRGTHDGHLWLGSQAVTVAPGTAFVVDLAGTTVRELYPASYEYLILFVSRRLMRSAIACAEDLCGTLIPAANESLRLLGHYVTTLLDDKVLSDSDMLARAAQHLVDLAALAIGTDRDNTEIARLRGLRAARLAAVLRCIRHDYADPELSPTLVARRVGISTRYLHELLHETEASFSERVQDLRLARAFALLGGNECGGHKISDAAYEAGFNDLSYFNRSFRRKYGLTPTTARAAAPRPIASRKVR
jgi:AraC-like DNA-binding protein